MSVNIRVLSVAVGFDSVDRKRTIHKLQVEYEKLNNRKKDKANKLIHYLCTKYSTIYMQDELVGLWHKYLI